MTASPSTATRADMLAAGWELIAEASGPPGCGKTTMLNRAADMARGDYAEIRFEECDPTAGTLCERLWGKPDGG